MLAEKQEARLGMKLSEADYKALDECLTALLDAYKTGEVDLIRARTYIAHTITLAVMDNEGGFKEYIRVPPATRWKKTAEGN